MLGLVIDHLWQSTLFLALGAAAAYLLRRQAARWRYLVWFAVSMKFLVPFAVLTALGAQLAWREAPSVAADNEWHAIARQVFGPATAFEQGADESESAAADPAQALDRGAASETSPPVSGESRAGIVTPPSPSGVPTIPSIVLGVWLLGTCVVLVRWALRWLQLRALAREATRLEVPALPAGTPELRSCPSIMEPGIFGIFRPVLLIPAGIVDRLSAQQLGAIVRHECVHMERRDNLTASLHMLVEAVFWFHPLVWWVGARLVDERERACDEAVLAAGVEPEHYASGLIAICDFYVESPLLCAAGVGGGSLEDRVKRIADNDPAPPPARLTRGVMLAMPAAVFLIPLVIGLLSAPTVHGQRVAQLPTQGEARRQVLGPIGIAPAVYEYPSVNALPTSDMSSIAMSPDGTQLAFVAPHEGRNRLWVQNLATREARVLPGTNEVVYPFWSPDGRHLGFFNNDALTRIELATGVMQVLATAATAGAGGSWGADGTILFGRHGARTIQSVLPDGGRRSATRIASAGEAAHISPHFLPDGKHFLYYVEGLSDARGVYVSELVPRTSDECAALIRLLPRESPRSLVSEAQVAIETIPECALARNSTPRPDGRRLVESDAGGVYALGRLFFVQGGTLMAQPFDLGTMTLSGSPQAVAEEIPVARSGAALAAVGDQVIYRQGLQGSLQQLTWYDRAGNRLRTVGEPFRTAGGAPSLSPDGTRAVVNRVVDGLGKIFTVDLSSGTATRLSNDPGNNSYPIWSFDGQRVLFSSSRSGFSFDTYRQTPSFGSEAEKVFSDSAPWRHPMDWSRDGRYLVYRMGAAEVWAMEIATSIQVRVAAGRWPQISPDGRWIAYQTDAADGNSEIYIHGPFAPPSVGQRSAPISLAGGGWVRWGMNGRELFYIAPDGWLMAVPLSFAGDGFVAHEPERLFSVPTALGSVNRSQPHQYMVDNRGGAFLFLESAPAVSRVHRLGR